MNASAENPAKFTVSIPSIEVEANLIYYIEASDGKNTSRTVENKITVARPNLDFNKLPNLLVTEVVPDSSNIDGADGYEFIEIYNNSNQEILFKDYKIQYRYGTDPETDVIWESVPDDFVIASKETVVFWIINDKNGAKTVADFNAIIIKQTLWKIKTSSKFIPLGWQTAAQEESLLPRTQILKVQLPIIMKNQA